MVWKSREKLKTERLAQVRAGLIADAKEKLDAYDTALTLTHDPIMSNPDRIAKLEARVKAAIQGIKDHDEAHGVTEVVTNGDE